jgi:serine/threonine protein kinase
MHPVKRRVALKILKPGMDSAQVLARFDSERQALAMMDHPNIARVLDAGTTPLGRPFFVMEHVKGVPITQYCDVQNLTVEERLEIFVTVCGALQHAHQKGIIHRDIKPSNVLVALQEDRPLAKVIDFGIAKALNQDLLADAAVTQQQQFIGTPAYMAPEQAVPGLDVDTRSDVYSLGVLLYELLSGQLPFEPSQLRGMPIAEMQRVIREHEPPRPSTRVGRGGRGGRGTRATGAGQGSHTGFEHGGPASAGYVSGGAGAVAGGGVGGGGGGGGAAPTVEHIARCRRSEPRALRKVLAGELDWIVMKALEKDRRRRYQTASALAEDVQRYLRNDPVEARPATATYRLRKFARKNRLMIGAAGGIVAGLLLTMVALAYGLQEAQHERDMTARRETLTRAQILLTGMNAVRAYTTGHVRPAIQDKPGSYDNFKPEMIPAFGARRVFEKFRAAPDYNGFIYKEAAPNPTNPDHRADEFEQGLVEKFRKSPASPDETGVREIEGKPFFYIARAMKVNDTSCLDCHSTPDRAPPRQIELYGSENGFNWKMDDVIAVQMVYVPVTEAFHADRRGRLGLFLALGGVFVVGGLGAVMVLRKL